jgi:WD repeat-containing protein 44
VAPASAAMGIGMKPKTWCTIRSYENFYCKDVSAAVPWPHTPFPPGGDSPSSSSSSGNEESCSVATHGAVKPPADGSGELSRNDHGGAKGGDGGNAWGLVVVAVATSRGGGDQGVPQL